MTTVTCPTSIPATGSPLTPCTATVTGAGGLNQSLTVSYLNNTDTGTATANASYAGTSTYAASTGSTTFAITSGSGTVSPSVTDSDLPDTALSITLGAHSMHGSGDRRRRIGPDADCHLHQQR